MLGGVYDPLMIAQACRGKAFLAYATFDEVSLSHNCSVFRVWSLRFGMRLELKLLI